MVFFVLLYQHSSYVAPYMVQELGFFLPQKRPWLLRARWNQDGLELDDEDWQEAVASPREVAIQARLRLVQLKILHRIYITSSVRVHLNRTDDGKCRRRCGEEGTFMHIIWDCVLIQQYWEKVHSTISEVLQVKFHLEARRALLNVWGPTDLTYYTKTWVILALMLAKRNIAQRWGSLQTPAFIKWKEDIDWCMFREKHVCVARGCPDKWIRIWEPWNVYRGHLCSPPRVVPAAEIPAP